MWTDFRTYSVSSDSVLCPAQSEVLFLRCHELSSGATGTHRPQFLTPFTVHSQWFDDGGVMLLRPLFHEHFGQNRAFFSFMLIFILAISTMSGIYKLSYGSCLTVLIFIFHSSPPPSVSHLPSPSLFSCLYNTSVFFLPLRDLVIILNPPRRTQVPYHILKPADC